MELVVLGIGITIFCMMLVIAIWRKSSMISGLAALIGILIMTAYITSGFSLTYYSAGTLVTVGSDSAYLLGSLFGVLDIFAWLGVFGLRGHH